MTRPEPAPVAPGARLRRLPLWEPAAPPFSAAKVSFEKERVVERPTPRAARVSLTDWCDFACVYCRPSRSDGYSTERLDERAWGAVFEALSSEGVRRVRFTGGEPLLHPHVVSLVALAASFGFHDLALTTNASRLARLAGPLRRAGLHRLNVSLDSLRADRFAELTRGGRLSDVLAGVDAALAAGFAPIKVNVVVIRGQNDHEIDDIVTWAWELRLVPRFLEVMSIGEGAKFVGAVVPAAELRARLGARLASRPWSTELDRGPARYVASRHDPSLRVGFISGSSDTYCASCDRLRVTSSGDFRSCLARPDGVSARAFAHEGDVAGVVQALRRSWEQKPSGSFDGCNESSARALSMRAVGG